MQATVIQRPGTTWTLQIEIPAFPDMETLGRMVGEAISEKASEAVKEAVSETACLKVPVVAELLGIKTVATVRGYFKLNPNHPKYLAHIPGDNGVMGDTVPLFAVRAWAERNSKPDALTRIAQHESKSTRRR